MTPERQNEIWAFLTPEEKAKYREEYLAPSEDIWNDWEIGYDAALKSIFGEHNLTAQAGEKPKKGLLDKIIDAGYNFLDRHNPDVIPERGISNIDYTRYRLDLAKEIAVAMIPTYVKEYTLSEMGEIAVETANEIVKRLKETDNAD